MEETKRHLSINVAAAASAEKERDPEAADGGERVPLSPVSRMLHRPNTYWTTIAMMGSSTEIDVDAVKAGLETTIIRHPRFSSILASEKPGGAKKIWQRTRVVIDDHVIVPNLNPQDSGTSPSRSPDQLVEDYVSSLSTATFPLSKPLWDLHILNIPTSEAKAMFVFRIHHSIGDGVSLMSLLLACGRKLSDPNSLPSLPGGLGRRRPKGPGSGTASRLGGPCGAFVLLAWAMLVGLWNTLVDVMLFLLTTLLLKDNAMPLAGKDQAKLPPKRALHRTVSLDDVKAVKNAVGCTVNDVFIGVTSAGLSRYLSRRYEEDEKNNNNKKKKIRLDNVRCRAILAVNIRPAAGIHALTEMMEGGSGRTAWGNRIGFGLLQFPIVMFEDPLDYVRKGTKVAQRTVKNNYVALVSNFCVTLVARFGGKKVMADWCRRGFQNTTGTFSNVVGPVEEISFYGHPLVYIAPTVYGLPQPIGLHFNSYANKVKIVLAADELLVHDPQQLLDDLDESLKLIKDSTLRM